MKASDCIVKFLESQNITHVFGYQGGMITHLVDSLSKSNKVKYIQCYHEQSAAIVAEAMLWNLVNMVLQFLQVGLVLQI